MHYLQCNLSLSLTLKHAFGLHNTRINSLTLEPSVMCHSGFNDLSYALMADLPQLSRSNVTTVHTNESLNSSNRLFCINNISLHKQQHVTILSPLIFYLQNNKLIIHLPMEYCTSYNGWTYNVSVLNNILVCIQVKPTGRELRHHEHVLVWPCPGAAIHQSKQTCSGG